MSKRKKDSKSGPSPEPDANVDPSTTIEPDPQSDPAQGEPNIPEAQIDDPTISNDPSEENLVGEMQRRLDDAQAQNQHRQKCGCRVNSPFRSLFWVHVVEPPDSVIGSCKVGQESGARVPLGGAVHEELLLGSL